MAGAPPRVMDADLELNEFMREFEGRIERERCEKSLIEFLIASWRHMGESGELVINWHHRVIAAHLEAQARGYPRNLILNQPPRTTKSLLVSVALPAWIWAQPEQDWSSLMGPHVRFLCVSYGATLAEEIAVKMRRLVQSTWYQQHWGHQVRIRDDQGSRSNFANYNGGERISTSIEGGILGRGGDWQIIDDPHHVKGAESDTQRRETIEGMRSLVTRVTDPRIAARTLVMQRLHEDDATNYAIEHWGRVTHLMFPMRFDAPRGIPEDEREEDGDLLWPDVWTDEAVRQEEFELGDYGTAGQLQQAPVPRGGGIIKRDWWRLWPQDAGDDAATTGLYRCDACGWNSRQPTLFGASVECQSCGHAANLVIVYPDTSFRLLSVDTAYSDADQEKNSWNAITRWGIWHGKDESPRAMLMQAWRGRPPLRGGSAKEMNGKAVKGLVEIVHEMATQGKVDVVLIEKKTRGPDLYNELDRLLRVHPYQLDFFEPTGRGDKVARLTSVQGFFTSDLIWAPERKWADMVIDEINSQPRAQFADLCDTATAALIYMRDRGLLRLPYEHQADKRRQLVFKGNRPGIAAMYEDA